jgi:hypothetical protein
MFIFLKSIFLLILDSVDTVSFCIILQLVPNETNQHSGDSPRYNSSAQVEPFIWVPNLCPQQWDTQIVERTSLTRSPDVHAHALFASAAIDFLMQGDTADIASTLDAAKTAYMACGSMLEAVLKVPFGDVETARATILECLSKSQGVYSDIPPLGLLFMSDPVYKMHGAMDTLRWAVVCFAWMQKAKDVYGTAQALRRFADICMIMGDEETALHLFHTTLDAGTKLDIHHVHAECMVGIGDIEATTCRRRKCGQLPILSFFVRMLGSHRTRHSQKGYNTASYQHIALPTTCASHNLQKSRRYVVRRQPASQPPPCA